MKNYLQRQQTFAPRIRKWGKENDGSLYNSNNLLRREGLNCASLILGTVSRSYALIHDVARQCWPCFAREWSWPKEPFSLSLSILNSLVRSFILSPRSSSLPHCTSPFVVRVLFPAVRQDLNEQNPRSAVDSPPSNGSCCCCCSVPPWSLPV